MTGGSFRSVWRDVEVQFQVKQKRGSMEEARGSFSYNQLMREAYPGGIYYHKLIEIPDESRMGLYNLGIGEITEVCS